MMVLSGRSVEKKGKSVEEAVGLALEELQVPRDRVSVEVLETPNRGLFGLIGGKDARVRVTFQPSVEEVALDFLKKVTRAMGMDVGIESSLSEEYLHINITGGDVGALIGHHGQTLEALQYLVSLVATRKSGDKVRVVLDIEGYRKRREETLRSLAARVADRVRRSGQTVALEPMSAQERRVIHLALQDHPGVETKSEGEDPYRKIVISRKA